MKVINLDVKYKLLFTYFTLKYVILTIVIFYTINFFININKHCSSTSSDSVEI